MLFTKYMYWEYDVQSSVLEAEGENKINVRILYQSCRGFQMVGGNHLVLTVRKS